MVSLVDGVEVVFILLVQIDHDGIAYSKRERNSVSNMGQIN